MLKNWVFDRFFDINFFSFINFHKYIKNQSLAIKFKILNLKQRIYMHDSSN